MFLTGCSMLLSIYAAIPPGVGSVVRRPSGGYIKRMGFGIGFQEMVIIGLLFLVLFGPSKLPQMARDLGRFVNEARRSIDEFKEELTAEYDEDDKENKERELKR
jgi:Tat protein translocase TatB subunit